MTVNKSLQLLTCFYYKNICSFIELCNSGGYSSDLGGYYIRQLMHDGYIEKIDRGQYQILSKGKHFLVANQTTLIAPPRARMSIALVLCQGDKYAVVRRTAQPFIDRIEWPTGSVKSGEPLSDAASRVAQERLGSPVKLEFHGFFRRIDMYEEDVFDDKLFAVHVGILPDGYVFKDGNKAGVNCLYTVEDLYKTAYPSRSLVDILSYTSTDPGSYIEHRYDLRSSDLSIE